MDISFIVLTWNSEKYISKCLRSIFAELEKSRFTYEIFLIDNGSQDRTVEILRSFQVRFPEHIIPIYLEKNTGTTYSRNLALKKAEGTYICIMDSDVEICTGTIEQLICTLENDVHTGLSVPRLVYPNGRLQKSTDSFPTITRKIWRYFFLKLMEKRENRLEVMALQNKGLNQRNRNREVDYAISALWMLKQEVLERVGLLDENFFYAPEDADYCLRIWRAGYKIVYTPEVSGIHHTQEISRRWGISRALLSHLEGLCYYFRKHKYLFRKPKVRQPSGRSKLFHEKFF